MELLVKACSNINSEPVASHMEEYICSVVYLFLFDCLIPVQHAFSPVVNVESTVNELRAGCWDSKNMHTPHRKAAWHYKPLHLTLISRVV